jgi:NDP-sugar pyrophosphorylase family protein
MNPRIRHAVILAAGRGQRMMPLTEAMPKAMAPYRGTTLIAQGIEQIRRHLPFVHVTVGYKGAMLAQHVIQNGAASVFNTEGQSNCWWIYNTLMRHIEEPVFVLTCDNVVELDFALLEQDYFDNGAPACMLVPVHPVAGLVGDYIFRRGNQVLDIDRHRASDVYCSGIQILRPAEVVARTDGEGDFYAVWRQLIQQQQVLTSRVYPKKWITIDTLDQLSRAAAFDESSLPPWSASGEG